MVDSLRPYINIYHYKWACYNGKRLLPDLLAEYVGKWSLRDLLIEHVGTQTAIARSLSWACRQHIKWACFKINGNPYSEPATKWQFDFIFLSFYSYDSTSHTQPSVYMVTVRNMCTIAGLTHKPRWDMNVAARKDVY